MVIRIIYVLYQIAMVHEYNHDGDEDQDDE